jgi:hypothetical protein
VDAPALRRAGNVTYQPPRHDSAWPVTPGPAYLCIYPSPTTRPTRPLSPFAFRGTRRDALHHVVPSKEVDRLGSCKTGLTERDEMNVLASTSLSVLNLWGWGQQDVQSEFESDCMFQYFEKPSRRSGVWDQRVPTRMVAITVGRERTLQAAQNLVTSGEFSASWSGQRPALARGRTFVRHPMVGFDITV